MRLMTYAWVARRRSRLWLLAAFLTTGLWTIVPITGTATAQEPLPDEPPDGVQGMEIFQERCANCHGPAGAGDGELAANLPQAPRDFSDPGFRLRAVPAEMVDIIGNGLIASGMPPFGAASSNPIDERGLWALTAAIYSLGTPPEVIERGREIYTTHCMACHGESGAGDGPQALNVQGIVPELSQAGYWLQRSNGQILAAISGENEGSAHRFQLENDQRLDAVEYARTFSYVPAEQGAATIIDQGVIEGQVVNGSTGNLLNGGTVLLRGFTPQLAAALTTESTIDEAGRFRFDLNETPADWIYLVTVPYGELSFSSEPARLELNNTTLDMPVIVYEPSTDDGAVLIDSVHVVLEFAEDRLMVSEIYVLSNLEPSVYVGQTGNPAGGTVKFALPAGAENINFQRSFGSAESFFPAAEVVQTESGWVDTLPLQPGSGAVYLLVNYDLPFEPGMIVAHPLHYETLGASVILPDAGVTLAGDSWLLAGESQSGSPAQTISYNHPALSTGEALTLRLVGRPARVMDVSGNMVAARDETAELLFGAGVLLFVVAIGFVSWRQWRHPAVQRLADVDVLLEKVADLDESFEAGAIAEADYSLQRAQLIESLVAAWPLGEN